MVAGRGYRFMREASKAMGLGWQVWADSNGFLLIRRDRKCLRILRTASGKWWTKDQTDMLRQLTESREDLMAKRMKLASGAPRPPHAGYADLLETMPSFAEFMTDSSFDDGMPRKGGWLCLWALQGSWRTKLKNDAEGLEIELAAPSWTDLLRLLEGSLTDPSAPWRPILGWQDPNAPRKGKR